MKKYISIFIFNLIDTFATLYLYSMPYFVELNPIVNWLLQTPVLFVIVKISLITLFLLRLWKERDDKRVQLAINIGFYIYGCVALYYTILVPIVVFTN